MLIKHHRVRAFADLDAGCFAAAVAANEFRHSIVAAHRNQQVIALIIRQTGRALALRQGILLHNPSRRDIDGNNLVGLRPYRIARMGVGFAPEESEV